MKVGHFQILSTSMLFRAIAAGTALALAAGCAISADPTGGQFGQIKQGMTRQEVITHLGEPARTDLANGFPTNDAYACDEQGQILKVKNSVGTFLAEGLVTLGIASLVDIIRAQDLAQRVRSCQVQYDPQSKVASTSVVGGGFALQSSH